MTNARIEAFNLRRNTIASVLSLGPGTQIQLRVGGRLLHCEILRVGKCGVIVRCWGVARPRRIDIAAIELADVSRVDSWAAIRAIRAEQADRDRKGIL